MEIAAGEKFVLGQPPRACCWSVRSRCPSADEATVRYFDNNRGRFTAPLPAVRHTGSRCAGRRRGAAFGPQSGASPAAGPGAQPGQFAELALKYLRRASSKAQGALLGQGEQGQTVPELERQLSTLAPGLAAKPLESRYGCT